MKKRRGKPGFTLVEIMIVVAIIGLLVAIAIPNFLRAREEARANSCVANLKQIEGAKERWAMSTNADQADVPGWTALVPDYLKIKPQCPSAPAGTDNYTVGAVNVVPVCAVGTNSSADEYDDHGLPYTTYQ